MVLARRWVLGRGFGGLPGCVWLRYGAGMIASRGARRTLSFGLQTVLGLRRRGFFVPLSSAAAGDAWRQRPYASLRPLFDAAAPEMTHWLDRIEAQADALAALRGPGPQPRFDQTWFPRLDAAALYTLVRTVSPARIVEVGSGHSTRFMARAIRDGALQTALIAIDPQPRADIRALPLTLIRSTVQNAGLAPFEALRPGDVLAIDSSHVAMPGTDVDLLLNRVVPMLPSGTYVTVHDIFLPEPYPNAWPFTAYNDQVALAPLLQGGADIAFASAHVVATMGERLANTWIGRQPLPDGARESLIVLRKR